MSQQVETTDDVEERSYQGDPNDWTIDDPHRGPSVPLCVRKAGATKPFERVEHENGGVSLIGHAAWYECEECGEETRFVSSSVVEQYRCSECGEIRWFNLRDVDYNEVK